MRTLQLLSIICSESYGLSISYEIEFCFRSTVRVEQRAGSSKLGNGFFHNGEDVVPKEFKETPEDLVHCIECNKMFLESVARVKFNLNVCDECR